MKTGRWFWVAVLCAVPAQAETAPSEPLLATQLPGDFKLEAPLLFATRFDGLSGYPVDGNGSKMPAGANFSPLLRGGLRLDSGRTWSKVNLLAEVEEDFITGTQPWHSTPSGLEMPNASGITQQLRKAYVRAVVARAFVALGGVTTNHWGLGLVANDGAHGWEPGSAVFMDPRGGDRVIRGMLSTVPFTKAGVLISAGYDRVIADDALVTTDQLPPGSTTPSDRANQIFLAAQVGYGRPTHGGVYAVRRWQYTGDGRSLLATIVDATGESELALGAKTKLRLGAEGAYIGGTTTLAPAPGNPTQTLQQFGAVARAGIDFGPLGAVVDVVYASGDPTLNGSSQNAFKANPNFTEGLFLFNQVMAAQTGRAPVTANEPNLQGYTPTGVDRYPTRGAITNTVTVFPRMWWRPVEHLELYGGPMFALAAASIVDPFNSFLAGEPRNALNGSPGDYLGTELDVGVRYRTNLHGTILGIGVEGGVLLPGSALNDASGHAMGNVGGGRVMIDYRL